MIFRAPQQLGLRPSAGKLLGETPAKRLNKLRTHEQVLQFWKHGGNFEMEMRKTTLVEYENEKIGGHLKDLNQGAPQLR